MKLEDTTITTAGVMRCCLATVADELSGEVREGDESACDHCGERFRLVWAPRVGFAEAGYRWLPLWQVEGRETP